VSKKFLVKLIVRRLQGCDLLWDVVQEGSKLVADSQNTEVKVDPFSHACALVSPLFACLGVAFKFAVMDYIVKVRDLEEASKSIQSL